MIERLIPRIVLLGMVVVLVATSAPAGLTAGEFHWARQSSQFTLQVGSNLDGPWPSILNKVVADWNKSDTVTFKVVSGGTNPQECRPVTGRVEACNWRYGTQEGWLGLTRLYFDTSGDHIESATVQMNDSFFDTTGQYNNDAARRHTMCHEMGHATGLDHEVNTDSCMNDSQDAVFANLVPTKKNFKQLERTYAHSDSTTTVAGAQKKDKKPKKDKSRKDKGGKKHRDGGGGGRRGRNQHASGESIATQGTATETTIEMLPDGRRVLTFITWAQPEAIP